MRFPSFFPRLFFVQVLLLLLMPIIVTVVVVTTTQGHTAQLSHKSYDLSLLGAV